MSNNNYEKKNNDDNNNDILDKKLSLDEIEKTIIEQVSVDEEVHREVEHTLDILIEKINMHLVAMSVAGRVEKQGSFVRRTYLDEDDSYDLLLVLQKDERPKTHMILDTLVKRLKKDRVGKSFIQVIKITGKIPYLRIIANGLLVHLFTGFNISPGEKKISIFDLIPLHTDYILAHMRSEQKKEVLLLKKFTKTIGVYRTEIGATGFNGYLCELLILFYGTFRKTLEAISKWKPRVLIDIKKNKEKIEDVDAPTIELIQGYYPLFVSDPLSLRDNVAADVSLDQFNSIIAAANIYLTAPSLKFFVYYPVSLPSFSTLAEKIKDSGTTIIVLSSDRLHQESEVCWQKSLAIKKAVEKELKHNKYVIDRINPFTTDEKYGIIISLYSPYPRFTIRKEGPLITNGKDSLKFLHEYSTNANIISGPYIEDRRWVIYLTNKGQHINEFISSLLKQNTFILDVDSFLKLEIKNKLQIHSIETDLETFYNEDIEFAEQFYFFIERKPSWIVNIEEQ